MPPSTAERPAPLDRFAPPPSPWLMDPDGFQRELGVVIAIHSKPLLPLEEVDEALSQIAPMWCLLSCGWIWHSLWLMERLRQMKWQKKHPEHSWHSTREKLDWTQVRATIKAFHVVVKVMKHQYFFAFIAILWLYFRWHMPSWVEGAQRTPGRGLWKNLFNIG